MRSLLIAQSITARTEHSLKCYLIDISKAEMIKPEEEVILARKIKDGDQAALEKLVRANLRFVVSCAKKYQYLGLPLTDLINEGNIGLIKAATMFDETKGFKFISYAVWWIRQAMMAALNFDVRMIRLPMNLIKTTNDIKKTSERLEQLLERLPTEEEICAEMYVPTESMAMEYAFGKTMVSLDAQLKQDGETQLWSMLEDENCEATDQQVFTESMNIEVKRMLSVLSERDRIIVNDFFGFSDGLPRSFDEIGDKLNISSERVRQLKEAALKKIREKVGYRMG